MADEGGAIVGGCCGALCYGVLGQFFSTRTWGSGWTCWDKCCRCEACWDAGEFDPNDRPDADASAKQQPDEGVRPDAEGKGGDAPPPAYKATEQMTTAPNATATAGSTATAQTGAT